MGTVIRHQVFMLLAIAFICIAIFPLVFAFCASLMIQKVVTKKMSAKIDRFWDIIGIPYDYLIKAAG